MPNWAYGEVKVTGTREGIKSFVERFISNDEPSTIPGKKFFARSFLFAKRQEIIDKASEAFAEQSGNAKATHSFMIAFAWSAYCCLIEGYPHKNDNECLTLAEACIEDQVSVEIRTSEPGICFEEHITCDEAGNCVHMERDLSRCKCRNCGEISHFGSFEDIDEYECPECGSVGFERCEEE